MPHISRIIRFNWLLLAGSITILSAPVHAQSLAPLKLYWNADRGDNFTTATSIGEQSAIDAQYGFARVEGQVYTAPIPGTIALQLYWNAQRGDNCTAASAPAAGYGFVRVEGYMFRSRRPGTVPLKLFYSPARGDYFTTATNSGERSALEAGYRFISVEGYVLPGGGDY